MTKKDYKRIAEAIARARRENGWSPSYKGGLGRDGYLDAIRRVVDALADALKAERAEFSRERFAAACLED